VTERAPTTKRSPPIRIASVPAAHPYVQHLGSHGVVRLADPSLLGAPPGRWWPPVMVDPIWIEAHAADFDVMHLHFGTESFAPEHLVDTVAALRRAGRPLVYTVHDLQNPQLGEQTAHVAHLDVLVAQADALITLTPGAAAEIQRRWGRTADVVEHPNLFALDAEPPVGQRQAPFVVGLHLRDLRPNVDGVGATRTLLAAVAALRATGADVVARIELHDRVRDRAARAELRRRCADVAFVTLTERSRPSDAELAASLADLDVSTLPYSHGTHSGWVELCWDLGVPVAAPEVGYAAEQHADPDFFAAFTGGSPTSLTGALTGLLGLDDAAAWRARPRPGSQTRRALQVQRSTDRRAQRRRIADAHLAIYRRILRRPVG